MNNKNVSFVALATVLTVSCVLQEDYTKQATEEGMPVTFASVDVVTRAGAGIPDSVRNNGFRVFAWETGPEGWNAATRAGKPDFMPLGDDDKGLGVSWEAVYEGWTYSPVKFWPGKIDGTVYGKATFFSYTPDRDVSEVITTSSAQPALAFTSPLKAKDQADLMVDALYDRTYGTNDGAVNFRFKHVLSKIGFRARLSTDYADTEVVVDSLIILYNSNRIKRDGVYTFPAPDNVEGSWSESTSYMSGNDTLSTPHLAIDDRFEANYIDGGNYLMLLPQTTAEGDVDAILCYTVTTTNEVATSYKVRFPLPGIEWLQGKQHIYTFNLKLNSAETTVEVEDWGTGTGRIVPLNIECIDDEDHRYGIADFGAAGWWMTENLRSTTGLTVSTDYKYPLDDVNRPASHGLLYNWNSVFPARLEATTDTVGVGQTSSATKYRGVCPKGWHVPSDYEWSRLEREIATAPAGKYATGTGEGVWNDSYYTEAAAETDLSQTRGAYGYLMLSATPWHATQTATGLSKEDGGFNALLIVYPTGANLPAQLMTSFMTSSSAGADYYFARRLMYQTLPGIGRVLLSKGSTYASIRCTKD